jgi:hypothetical protein
VRCGEELPRISHRAHRDHGEKEDILRRIHADFRRGKGEKKRYFATFHLVNIDRIATIQLPCCFGANNLEERRLHFGRILCGSSLLTEIRLRKRKFATDGH